MPAPAPGFNQPNSNGNGNSDAKGKGRVLSELERRTEEIRKEEMMQEGRPVTKEGQEEAEACYVVSPT